MASMLYHHRDNPLQVTDVCCTCTLSAVTLSLQNLVIPVSSSSLVVGFTTACRKCFSSCHIIFIMGLRSHSQEVSSTSESNLIP